jgi:glycosyltransferase 2 family protein
MASTSSYGSHDVNITQHIFTRSLSSKLAITIALALLVLLFSGELSAWRKFDRSVFLANARYMRLLHVVTAVAIIHVCFLSRAVRWSIRLRTLRTVPTARLLGPTFVGFTGLALLGRPGELIHPYLIARKEGLSISSQMAVLTLERIFDTASAGTLIVCRNSVTARSGSTRFLTVEDEEACSLRRK